MNNNIKSIAVAALLLCINAAGITLRYFESDTYLILVGFRFHLTAIFILIFLFIYRKKVSPAHYLVKTVNHGKFLPPLILIIPLIAGGALYFMNILTLNDPEYFYEFGLSSIADFPVYLIWNTPQILLLVLFLFLFTEERKNKFIKYFILLFFLFVFEFIPFSPENVEYVLYGEFILSLIFLSLAVLFIKNIYWNIFLFFSFIWFLIIVFGSASETLIKVFFASNYESWEGFFTITESLKGYSNYLYAGFILLFLIASSVIIPVIKRKNGFSKEKSVH